MAASRLPPTFVHGFHDLAAVQRMKYRPLGRTGMIVSIVSLGASPLGNVYRKTNDDEAIQVVRTAIKKGINYIDTAAWYGHGRSEEVLGKALEGIPREAYYLATKACRYRPEVDQMFDFSAERTLRSIDQSLERLKIDYVDLLQVHDPEFAPSLKMVCEETIPTLQKIKEMGKCRFIGLTGYPMENFVKMVEGTSVQVDTALTYCHYSMNDTTLLDYMQFFEKRGIGVMSASPLSMGLLSNRGPPKWHPATQEIKETCRKAAEYCQSQGTDLSKLAMYFSLAEPSIPTTLVGTASLTNLQANIDVVTGSSLSPKEQEVSDYVMENFFKPLKKKDWENLEVDEYWAKMKKLGKAPPTS
ncbi:uncharacterized protein [Oscarella lobularis]|uniref:uncharacterized protein n=1 Tax=Oscarella lobularis TaxID=121494 RepID=UPI0033143ACB